MHNRVLGSASHLALLTLTLPPSSELCNRQVLTLMGAPLQILSLPGNGAPTGIAASADGFSVFIAQFDLHRLHRLSMCTGPPPGDIDVGLAAATDNNFEACGDRRIAAGFLSA